MKQVILYIPILLILFLGVGCEKENKYSNFVEGYIVATFRCEENTNISGQATAHIAKRGFIIMLENDVDSVFTFSLQEDIFEFPQESLNIGYNINNCGPIYFADSEKYKITFKYRYVEEFEKIKFVCGPCTFLERAFNWEAYRQVIIKEIDKH